MKKLFLIVITYMLTLTACNKPNINLPEDNGCIEKTIIPVTAHSINSADIATINNLFISNGIDNSKFRYYQYIHDTLKTFYAPYTAYDEKTVRVDQYINGVRLFTGDLVYNFLNNNFNSKGGDLTNGTSLNTSPQLSLGQIRNLFLGNIEEFDHAEDRFKDSCFKAEFGYFNLNSGTGNTEEVIVKTWRVTLKNSVYPSEYPVAYYQDKDGELIYYDNGIRTFN